MRPHRTSFVVAGLAIALLALPAVATAAPTLTIPPPSAVLNLPEIDPSTHHCTVVDLSGVASLLRGIWCT